MKNGKKKHTPTMKCSQCSVVFFLLILLLLILLIFFGGDMPSFTFFSCVFVLCEWTQEKESEKEVNGKSIGRERERECESVWHSQTNWCSVHFV